MRGGRGLFDTDTSVERECRCRRNGTWNSGRPVQVSLLVQLPLDLRQLLPLELSIFHGRQLFRTSLRKSRFQDRDDTRVLRDHDNFRQCGFWVSRDQQVLHCYHLFSLTIRSSGRLCGRGRESNLRASSPCSQHQVSFGPCLIQEREANGGMKLFVRRERVSWQTPITLLERRTPSEENPERDAWKPEKQA